MALILTYKLGNDLYGLEIDAVQEIIEHPELHYVPRAEGVLTGSINFHGQILAVIDLPALLGFAMKERDYRHLVLTPEHRSLVLAINNVERIVNLEMEHLQPPPDGHDRPAVRGVIDLDKSIINLLDTDEVIKQLEDIYAE
jgi:chemotaxis signal transduction protein